MLRRALRIVLFFFYYLKELLLSNVKVAKDVLRFKPRLSPGIVELEIDLKSDYAILTLANLITMTPGTLTIDLSSDKKKMYIHSLYLSDAGQLKQELKSGFELRIKELFE